VLINFYLLELYQDMYIILLFQNYVYQVLHIHFHGKDLVILS